jgi:hypothetical protein
VKERFLYYFLSNYTMADDTQIGMVVIIVAAIFLVSAMGLLEYRIIDEGISALIAFILVAYGVHLISKK